MTKIKIKNSLKNEGINPIQNFPKKKSKCRNITCILESLHIENFEILGVLEFHFASNNQNPVKIGA